MHKRWVELAVGLGLMLGPLAYALTLEPEVVEHVEVVEVLATPRAQLERVDVVPVQPAAEPAPVAPAEPEPVVEDDRIPFAFVNAAGIVLEPEAETAWGKGRLKAHAGPGEFRAAKAVDGVAVPQALWAQRGRSFDLYGASGKLCTVRLGDYAVLAQHDGPSLYDLIHGEDGTDWDAFDEEAVTPRQIRRAVWERAADTKPWLVAEIVGGPECEGALWARDASLPPPVILHPVDEGEPVLEARLAAHAESEVLAEREAEYRHFLAERPADERGFSGDWNTVAAESPATARAWLDAEGTPRLVELEFGADESSCGEGMDYSIRSIDVVNPDGGFEPYAGSVGALAIFDADLDGEWELLHESEDLSRGPDRLATESTGLMDSWYVDQIWYCPC